MTPTEVATILRQFNGQRRGDEDIPQFDPCKIGEVIDAVVDLIVRNADDAAYHGDSQALP